MRRLFSAVTLLCCALVLVFVTAVVLVPALLGLQRYVITGGSMTGSIPKGSVVYSELAPVEDLREGDVITFVPPERSEPVTHRIVTIQQLEDGQLVFRTKGDANAAIDPWKMTLNEPVQARYVFHAPYAGYVLAALANRTQRMLLVGLPAALIAISLLWSIWRRPRDEKGAWRDEHEHDDVNDTGTIEGAGART